MSDEVEALLKQLTTPHWNIRKKAIEDLMKLEADTRAAVPLLINALFDRSRKVRVTSARALSKIGSCLDVDDELREEIEMGLLNLMMLCSTYNSFFASVKALTDLGSGAATVTHLVDSLRESDEGIKINSLDALKRIGAGDFESLREFGFEGWEPIQALIDTLEDPEKRVRRSAAQALVELGVSDQTFLPMLIKASEDPDVFVRRYIYRLLGRLASATEVMPLLMKALREEESYETYASDALVEVGSIAVPSLIEALKDQDKKMRLKAAYTLNGIGMQAQEAVPALVQALQDSEFHVKRWASSALAKIGIHAFPALIEALRTRDEELQEYITNIFGEMDLEVVPFLIKALEKEEESQRKMIAKALHKLGSEGILEIIRIKNKLN